MEVCETTVRPTDGAVEHPRMDSLRVGERIPWLTYNSALKYRPPNFMPLTALSTPCIALFSTQQSNFGKRIISYQKKRSNPQALGIYPINFIAS